MGTRSKGKKPLPKGAGRWFIRQARAAIEATQREANLYHAISESEVEALVDLFRGEDPKRYMEWQPDSPDEFRAGVYGGKWTIEWDAFSVALKRFEDALRSQMTLDQWLAADMAATLDPGAVGGSRILDATTRAKLAEQARRRKGAQ